MAADPSVLRLLRAAAVLGLLEALALVVLGGVEAASISSDRLAEGITTTVFFYLYALGVGVSALGLSRARSWSRAPLLLTQLIQLGLAWSFVGGSTTWVSVALAVPAVAVVVVLLLPATTEALYGASRRDDARSG